MEPETYNYTDNMVDCEAMIVGAGPAGISTWLHLQRYAPELANRTIVIDKAVFPREKLCAGAVGGWSSDVFKGLEINLDTPCLVVSHADFVFGNEVYHFHRSNCFMLVQRIEFDDALVKIAVKRGLQLHESEKLIDITRNRNRLRVKTNRKKYRMQVIIGADGALSSVRRKMMPPKKLHLAPTIQIYSRVDPNRDAEFKEKKIRIDLTPIREGLQGYVWHFPCLRDGVPSVARGIGDFRIHPNRQRAEIKKIFSRELQSRKIDPKAKSWSSHPIHWYSGKDIISRPNVILVGDAAGIEPAFGGGIHLALSYGDLAARAIVAAFDENDFTFDDYEKRLQSHVVGKSIAHCTHLAKKMYGAKMHPLDVARELFSENPNPPPPNLLSLFLGGNRP